jgi:hypothetical protein
MLSLIGGHAFVKLRRKQSQRAWFREITGGTGTWRIEFSNVFPSFRGTGEESWELTTFSTAVAMVRHPFYVMVMYKSYWANLVHGL